MAFPSFDSLAKAWLDALTLARTLKGQAQILRDTSAAGNIGFTLIERFFEFIVAANARFEQLKAVPGIAQYAKDQVDNQLIDIVAEFNAMQTAIVDVITWVTTNIPKDGSGYLLVRQIDVGNNIVDRQFTPAQSAGLRTQLDALLATIA